jgi:hypothetical protein
MELMQWLHMTGPLQAGQTKELGNGRFQAFTVENWISEEYGRRSSAGIASKAAAMLPYVPIFILGETSGMSHILTQSCWFQRP